MFGVIIVIVVVVTVFIGAVGSFLFKRRQAENRRREALAKPMEPTVFIPGMNLLLFGELTLGLGSETITGVRVPPPTYNVDNPPSYADISRKSENENMV